MDGNWSETTTAAADIRASLYDAYDRIMDDLLAYPQQPDPVWVMSQSAYHKMATIFLRAEWKEVYRAARVLKKRHLAYEHFGQRRRAA